MSNRASAERRPASFVVGVLVGAAAVGAYAISCDSMTPATSGPGASATEVQYTNGRSGLTATTVQDALDEIGTTMRAATAQSGGVVMPPGDPATGSSVWTIEANVLDPDTEAMTARAMGTVTFTESAQGQGTYVTSGANVFMLDGLFGAATGTQTGKYFLVGDWLLMTGQTNATKTGLTWLARLNESGRRMTLNNGGAVVLALTKQQ